MGTRMTVYSPKDLTNLADRIRFRIDCDGAQHAMWNVVFDLEEYARGDDGLIDRKEVVRLAKEFLGEK